MKKLIIILIILNAMLSGCYQKSSGSFVKETDAIIDNRDSWLYYVKRADELRYSGRNITDSQNIRSDIYRAKYDGTQKQKLVEGKIQNTIMNGDYIFYTKDNEKNTYICRLDGSDNRVFLKDRYVNIVKVIDNFVYYIDINYSKTSYIPRLYRNNLSGQNEKLLFEGNLTSLYIDKEYIYYINNSENNNIFRMKTDGSNKTNIVERSVSKFLIDKDKIYYSAYNYFANNEKMIILNDHITKAMSSRAYGHSNNNTEVEGGFFSADLNGSNEVKLLLDSYNNFNINKDWIYYTGGGSGLYRMKKDGSQKLKLITDSVLYDYRMTKSSVYSFNSEPNLKLDIYGDYLYYINNFDKSRLYRIKTDKTGKERVINDVEIGSYLLGDGCIFYNGSNNNGHIYRVNTDGTNKILID